jgi:hypothetical protein
MDFKKTSGGRSHDLLFISATGPAVWPHLLTPDTRFDEAGKYKVGIGLEPDEARAVREGLTDLFRRAYPDVKAEPHLPIKVEDGRPYLVAKSTYRPKLYSPDRKEIAAPLLVRNGHRIAVSGRLRPFRNGGLVSGVACYLGGVVIHEPLDGLETYRLPDREERPFLAVPNKLTPHTAPPEDDYPF